MITCIVGFPGSGKTTDAARRTRKFRKKGIKVYSNIPELTDTIPVTLKDLGKFSLHDGVLIFDEAGIELNNRSYKTFPREAIEFFKLHRHDRMDIFIYSQAEDYDVTVRRLCERMYIIRKSRIRCFSSLQLVYPQWVSDQITGQVRVQWVMAPFPTGIEWFLRLRFYKYFDSWTRPPLPPLPAEIAFNNRVNNGLPPA